MSSHQKPYLAGLVVVGAATLLFALGRVVIVLLAAHVLQGFSSAIVFTIGCGLLLDTVGQENIGQAIRFTDVGLNLGVFIGPIMGRFLYQWGGYFPVFIPAFVLIGVEVLLRLMAFTKDRSAEAAESQPPSKPILEPALLETAKSVKQSMAH